MVAYTAPAIGGGMVIYGIPLLYIIMYIILAIIIYYCIYVLYKHYKGGY